MEPRQVAPGTPHERPAVPQGGEFQQLPELSPESISELGAAERAPERPAALEQAPQVPQALPTIPVAAPSPAPDDNASAVQIGDDTVPAVAADEDLIEKEWIDKAKKIIEDTKDDPYRREQEIGRLQREYIRKRYGREIGEPSS